jgi:LPXTG-site transpeptidase (sortase) family protein
MAYNKAVMSDLFEKKHLQFIGLFAGVFILSVILLTVLGLIPSELQEESNGYNFSQSLEHSILSFLGVSDSADSNTIQQGNGTNNAAHTTTNIDDSPRSVLNPSLQNSTSGAHSTSGTQIHSSWIPATLVIPSIDVSTVIRNPMSDSISTLDYELTKGVVRYPGSGNVGSGNMFIFGHSTSFSVVQNKAYKVFNNIHTLHAGDEISVIAIDAKTSARKTFVYKVRDVTKVNKDETLIKFDTKNNMLTLSTCNSFGSKSDRYVVQADFVGVR